MLNEFGDTTDILDLVISNRERRCLARLEGRCLTPRLSDVGLCWVPRPRSSKTDGSGSGTTRGGRTATSLLESTTATCPDKETTAAKHWICAYVGGRSGKYLSTSIPMTDRYGLMETAKHP